MIQHDVMIKLIDMPEAEKVKACNKIKEIIEALKKDIEVIQSIKVGINISPRDIAFDVIASSTFNNQEDLDIFRPHKAHMKAVEYIEKVAKQSVLVDHVI